MANSYTPYLNLLLPEVGSDTNAWGTHLNTDLSTIDTHILSRALTTSQTAAGPMVFGQTFRVNGAVTFDSTLLVTGNTTLSGTSAHTGAATFSSTLAVTGATTLSSTLAVTGNTTLSGTLAVTGATTLAANGLNVGSGQLNVTGGNVSMSGNLAVTGNAGLTTLSASGAATLSSTLAVTGATTLNAATTINLASAGALNINTSGNLNGLRFYNGGTITGQIGASSTYPLYVSNSAGSAMIYTDTSGNFTASANITAYSDAKLKTDIKTIEDAVELISAIRGVYYKRIDTEEAGIGVIAQEIQKVFPEAVHDNDGTLSVAYGNLIGPLIEAVKDLSKRVKKLEAR